MKNFSNRIIFIRLLPFLMILLLSGTICANADTVEEYMIYKGRSEIEFDSSMGPAYTINYADKTILSCSSEGAVIRKCTIADNMLTLVLYSDELPENTTYVFDLSRPVGKTLTDDKIEYYKVNASGSTIEFDSEQGPLYQINYQTKEILSCSSEGAVIKKCSVTGNKLTLILYSDEYPQDYTYTFDLSETSASKDKIDYYRVYPYASVIEFDTAAGPYYRINYKKKKILLCTSGNASIKKITLTGNKLKLTLHSDELSSNTSYTFILTKNNIKKGKLPVQIKARSFIGTNGLTYGLVNGEAVLIEVDKRNTKKVTIPAYVKWDKWKIPVTGIAPNAFSGMQNLTTVTIGKNVKAIGKQAFLNCKKLKTITINTKNLTAKNVMKNAFRGIHSKAIVTCPKGKVKAYRNILPAKGMPSTVQFK